MTITISAYNYAQFLPQAIESALKQDYPEFEIVVVDDGSKDNTADVAKQYVEKYPGQVRYVYQTNAGLSAARNTGIREARFDYIAFLDADDQFDPAMLRCMMAAFAELPAEFAVVACGTKYMDIHGTEIRRKKGINDQRQEITTRDIILKNRFSADAVIVKKSVFQECGSFDTTLRSSEDRDMWIRIAAHRRICLLPDALLWVRLHSNSMSKHADRMKQNCGKVIVKAYQNRLVAPYKLWFWLRAWSFFYFQTAWMYRDESRRARAMRDMVISMSLWPMFLHSRQLNEPVLFRLRALIRFARESCTKRAG